MARSLRTAHSEPHVCRQCLKSACVQQGSIAEVMGARAELGEDGTQPARRAQSKAHASAELTAHEVKRVQQGNDAGVPGGGENMGEVQQGNIAAVPGVGERVWAKCSQSR